MNIKEATQIVDNPPPINWEWLAGFFQAEGCLTMHTNALGYTQPRINITQKELQPLNLIKSFVETELHYTPKLHKNPSGSATNLMIMRKEAVAQFLQHATPYLRDNKRYIESITPTPLGWDFVAGFWEGDGSVMTREIGGLHYAFNQSTPELLQEIQTLIGKGSIHVDKQHKGFKPSNTICLLHIYDGKKTLELTKTILQHTRTHPRRMQIVCCLLEAGLGI